MSTAAPLTPLRAAPPGTAAAAPPRLFRRPDHGVAGVAAGIAEHIGVRPRTIRILFLALATAGGLGIALYGAYWIVVPTAPGVKRRMPPWLEYTVAGLVGFLAVGTLATTSLPAGGLFLPTTLACLGGALI